MAIRFGQINIKNPHMQPYIQTTNAKVAISEMFRPLTGFAKISQTTIPRMTNCERKVSFDDVSGLPLLGQPEYGEGGHRGLQEGVGW